MKLVVLCSFAAIWLTERLKYDPIDIILLEGEEDKEQVSLIVIIVKPRYSNRAFDTGYDASSVE